MPSDRHQTTRAEAIRVALRRTWGLNVGEMEHPVNLPTFDAALRAAGYIVVPVEPTEAMLEAAELAADPAIAASLAEWERTSGPLSGENSRAYLRGAEDMRQALADWLMCGCEPSQRLAVVAAAIQGGDNCGLRWKACSRSDCLALLSCEALDQPLPRIKP
jgi:hypothetical protein